MTSPTASDAGTWLPTLPPWLTRNPDMTPHATRIAIIGAGKGGMALPDLLHQIPDVEIVRNHGQGPAAPGLQRARDLHVLVEPHVSDLIQNEQVGLIMDVTGDPSMNAMIPGHAKRPDAEVLSGAAATALETLFSINQHLRPNCSRPTNWPVWGRLRRHRTRHQQPPAVDSRPCGKSRG